MNCACGFPDSPGYVHAEKGCLPDNLLPPERFLEQMAGTVKELQKPNCVPEVAGNACSDQKPDGSVKRHPLNPEPEPAMTFDQWYAEFGTLLDKFWDVVVQYERERDSCDPIAQQDALLAHAKRRISG